MSTLGKILVGLNLVLAAAFFGWAANATKTNQQWREKYNESTERLTKDKTTLEAEVQTIKAARIAGEKDLALLRGEVDKAKNDKERIQGELSDASARLANLSADVTKFSTTIQSIEADQTRLQGDKDKAEKAQRDAEAARADAESKRDDAEKLANGLKLDLEKANNMIADLEKTRTGLEKDKASLETSLVTLQANTGASSEDFEQMPDIPAAVLDVSNAVEPGLVALNVGSNKKVKRGFTFEIYEGKTYKGQVRVEFVHPEMCSAVIVRQVPGQTIKQGDSAATRL